MKPATSYAPPEKESHSHTQDVVVVGLGYVGLPLVVACANAGLRVTGYDSDSTLVAQLAVGRTHVGDVSVDDLKSASVSDVNFTDDPAAIAKATYVILCIPTPLDAERQPDLSAVKAAAACVATYLTEGTTVILESTSYPGTTEEVVLPILERSGLKAGSQFHLAYSPERTDPGSETHDRRNTPKIVGGLTKTCSESAQAFYSSFVDEIVIVRGPREAEMAKVFENAYRLVNISLVNEMVMLSSRLGIDFWEVLEAASTKPFGFTPFFPGPGVGGHCIPVDPLYLSFKAELVGHRSTMITAAAEVNDAMPQYVAYRSATALGTAGKSLKGSAVLVLGVAYKANVGDIRESPARGVVAALLDAGALVSYHDPYVPAWPDFDDVIRRVEVLHSGLDDADLVLVLQRHSEYELASFDSARLVLDARGFIDGDNVTRI